MTRMSQPGSSPAQAAETHITLTVSGTDTTNTDPTCQHVRLTLYATAGYLRTPRTRPLPLALSDVCCNLALPERQLSTRHDKPRKQSPIQRIKGIRPAPRPSTTSQNRHFSLLSVASIPQTRYRNPTASRFLQTPTRQGNQNPGLVSASGRPQSYKHPPN